MKICLNTSLLATVMAFLGLGTASGQLIYKANPELEWEVRVQSVRGGNGVFLSPVDDALVSTTSLGYVNAFDPDTGDELWAYAPNATDNDFLSCKSGVTFSSTDSTDYLVYSVLVNELSLNPMT